MSTKRYTVNADTSEGAWSVDEASPKQFIKNILKADPAEGVRLVD